MDPHAGAGAGGRPRRRALTVLCATEIVSYGTLYYAFPVLAGDITASTGWSRTAITAAFSAGNLAGAVAGVAAGRLIDRRGPRPVMTAGSVLATAALAGIATAPTLAWFTAAWLVAGIGMAGVFYPPAFAALTGWYGPDRVRALTTMTLSAFALYAVAVNLVPLLTGRGLSPVMAAWALGLGGAGQVAGRLCYRPLLAKAGVRTRAVAITSAGGACILILAVLPGQAALLTAASVLCGAARGLFTLLEATVVSDHWGPAGYASLNGVFSAPLTAATAIAPTVGAALAALAGGYPALFLILAGTGAASAALALASGPAPQPAAGVLPASAAPAD